MCTRSEIAACLRGFHHAKGVFLAWHGEIDFIVARNLQKDAGIGPTFVGLTCGMQKTRAKAEDGGDFLCVANVVPDYLQRAFIRFVHCDVGEDSEVVARIDPIEVRFHKVVQRRRAAESRGIFGVDVELEPFRFKEG